MEAVLPTAEKVEILARLVDAGLTRIEATSFVSRRAVPSMADAEALADELRRWPHVHWSALVASPAGSLRAVQRGITALEYVVSATDGHSEANVHKTTKQSLSHVAEIADAVHEVGGTCEVVVATAWDCPFDGPTPSERTVTVALTAVERGADRLCLCDTIGTATPLRVVDLVQEVQANCPDVPIGVHMHNTRGSGLASILAAMQVGVEDFDASIGGLGGCPFAPGASGNVATEELAYMCGDMGIETGLELSRLLTAAQFVEDLIDRQLPSGLLRSGDRAR
jgi:hydroxymethylglutaryl-CoA lyase